jgi:hypothetical protein
LVLLSDEDAHRSRASGTTPADPPLAGGYHAILIPAGGQTADGPPPHVLARLERAVHLYEMSPDPLQMRYELVGTMQPANEPDNTPTANRRFVKARFAQSDWYLLCHVDGFKVEYSTMSDAEARKLFKVKEPPPSPVTRRGSLGLSTYKMVTNNDGDDQLEDKAYLIDQLFALVDSNGDGTIEAAELKAALENDPEVKGIFQVLAGVGKDPNRLLECLEREGPFNKLKVINFFENPVVDMSSPFSRDGRRPMKTSRSGRWVSLGLDSADPLGVVAEEQPKAIEETATLGLAPSALPSEPLELPPIVPASWGGGLLQRFDRRLLP